MSRRVRSEFGTLADRVAASSVAPASAEAVPSSDAQPEPGEVTDVREAQPSHVWVDVDQAGLLIGWGRNSAGGWVARVMWCPPGQPYAAIDWIVAGRVSPAESR